MRTETVGRVPRGDGGAGAGPGRSGGDAGRGRGGSSAAPTVVPPPAQPRERPPRRASASSDFDILLRPSIFRSFAMLYSSSRVRAS